MRKFGRKKDHRGQMLKNLTASVILYESVETTEPKAKEVSAIIDKTINLAKNKTLDAKRKLLGYFTDKNVVKKLYEEIIPRYPNTNSGYTRIYKIGYRVGDGAAKVLIKLTQAKVEKLETKVEKK